MLCVAVSDLGIVFSSGPIDSGVRGLIGLIREGSATKFVGPETAIGFAGRKKNRDAWKIERHRIF